MAKKEATKEAGKRGRKPVDPNETPEQKFQRLAKHRVTRCIKVIRGLGNLGGAGYKSTDYQREKIREILNSELEAAMARMERAKQSSEVEFSL